jgi:hypothetical protein
MTEFTSLDELLRALPGDAPAIGIVVAPSLRAGLLAALTTTDRHVICVPGDPGIQSPAPVGAIRTAESWRDALLVELRREQSAAQERVAVAREQGGTPDPFDRDVAGWLAAGLCDLFADKITGESFLTGVFARLAADAANANFVESDFLRPDGIRFLEACRPAQAMLTKLSLASTSQFRALAVRLMNQMKSNLAVCSIVVVGESETEVRERLPELATLFRLVEMAPAIRPAIVEDLERLLDDLRLASAQTELFRQRGLANVEAPEEIKAELATLLAAAGIAYDTAQHLLERGQTALATVRQSLAAAFQRWFADQLASIDAEWFLRQDPEWDFLDVTRYMDGVREILLRTDDTAIKLPATEAEFVSVEKFIASLKDLDDQWRTHLWTQVEEGMAFDAAVAAGGAPLEMLTEGVEWWLKKENRDWKKYRIVRGD